MTKKTTNASSLGLFDEMKERVLSVLSSGERQDQLILIIPSHDRKNKRLGDQAMWADAAANLFAQLFGGATAFKALAGVFRTDDGDILTDEPILLECYANRADVESETHLNGLLEFAVRMGKETKQDTVALVINDFMHYIKIAGR